MKNWPLTLAVLASIAACGYFNGQGDAEKYAKEWVDTNLQGAKHTSFTCTGRDTDDNGYVSCTASAMWEGETRPDIIPLECATGKSTGGGCGSSGCKALPTFQNNRRR